MSIRFKNTSMAAIGECMLELSEASSAGHDKSLLQLGFGGDTLNTALYAARLGVNAHYVTALGDDARSHWLIEQWQKERIHTDCVHTLEGRQPGLYWIKTDSQGERSFAYWRGESAARELFDDQQRVVALKHQLASVGLVYFSGISLSLYSASGLQQFWELLTTLRAQGVVLAFDGNYRPRGWQCSEDARSAFSQAYSLCHIALPTYDDEVMLFGDRSEQETIDRLTAHGLQEVIVKRGPRGCLVAAEGNCSEVIASPCLRPVDTTAAGDSFNGAYLAARLAQWSPEDAAAAGNALAGTVIMHPGAIIAQSAMPQDLLLRLSQ